MCGPDESPRGSTLRELLRGLGAISVIHNLAPEDTAIPRNFSINFLSPDSNSSACAIIETESKEMDAVLREARVQIHNDGDLRNLNLSSEDKKTGLLLDLVIGRHALSESLNPQLTGRRTLIAAVPTLSFAVPDGKVSTSRGIIGRRISIIHEDGHLIGNGVLGWA